MTTPQHLLRQRRRRTQRGAAVFVVMLVITLVAALGLFAVRSSSIANLSSGYNRQLTQVHYITDLAVAAAVADIGDNPEGVKRQMELGPKVGEGEVICVAYNEVNKPTCWMRSYDDIQKTVTTRNAAGKLIEPVAAGKVGSLGPVPLEADMRIELTDLHPALPVAGFQQAGGSEANIQQMHAYVTVSASGLVRPEQTAVNTWNTEVASATGVELSRAHVIMGPVQMQR